MKYLKICAISAIVLTALLGLFGCRDGRHFHGDRSRGEERFYRNIDDRHDDNRRDDDRIYDDHR